MTAAASSWIGLAFGFGAAISYAGLNTAIRFADVHMSVWHIMFYRSLFGVAAMTLLARATAENVRGRRRETLTLLGIAGAVGITALTVALIVLPLFEALVLLYLFPVFSALLSPWLTDDPIDAAQWLLIAGACLGAVLVLWSGEQVDALGWGHLLGLVAAFCLGLTFTLTRRVSTDNSPLIPFFYISAAGLVLSLTAILAQSMTLAIPVAGLTPLAVVALLATTAHLAGNTALKYLPSPQVGVICMAEVPLGALIGLLVFGEVLGGRTVLGGILIVGAGIGLTCGCVRKCGGPQR